MDEKIKPVAEMSVIECSAAYALELDRERPRPRVLQALERRLTELRIQNGIPIKNQDKNWFAGTFNN